MTVLRFTTTPMRPQVVGATTFLLLPPEARDTLGGARVPVRVTIGDYSFRTTTLAYDGGLRIAFGSEHRDASGVGAGDLIEGEVVRDDSPRPIDVPEELAALLSDDPTMSEAFAALSPSHRREWCRYVGEAKKVETRQARADRAVAGILARRRPS